MKTDLVPQNVAMKVDRPKKNDFQPVFLDASQLARLFEAVKGTKLELIVLVAASLYDAVSEEAREGGTRDRAEAREPRVSAS